MKHCKCGNVIPEKRYKLGYFTCLSCGGKKAEASRHKPRTAPAYNKGPHMVVTSRDMAKDVGK